MNASSVVRIDGSARSIAKTACGCLCALLLATSAGAQSVSSLFTTIPADFAHLFTPAGGIVLGIGGAGAAAIHPKDEEIARRIQQSSGGRATFFGGGNVLGDTPVQGGVAIGAYVLGRLSERPRLTTTGADLIDAQIVNAVLTQGLKAAVGRTRPNGSPRSFPSGHTSATFTTAAVIQEHYGMKVALPFYALGGYVGVSRLVDRKHFTSDVIFGAAIGMASGHAAALGHGPHRIAVQPALSPSGWMIVGSIDR